MSCEDCDNAQGKGKITYYRWKNGNIAISGCRKHVTEIIKVLNEKQKETK